MFSSGALHYIPQGSRKEIVSNFKKFTKPGGMHAFMVPVYKPFLRMNPQDDPQEEDWFSGEILTHYRDWKIEYFTGEILDDISGYKWAANRIIAREPSKLF